MYDYIIVGSGFFGSVCARELTDKGFKCLVLEKRSHIGGNCHSEKIDGINMHTYGPHIFHTSNERVWKWINQYAKFNHYTNRPVANYKGELFTLPFNMWTFNQLWGVTHPHEAKAIIAEQSKEIGEPQNLEEQAIKLVGRDVYEKLIKGYTSKQWMKPPNELPKEIIKRLPVRFTYDTNYFNDPYQGIPIGGYTPIFDQLLAGIEVQLETDYLADKSAWDAKGKNIIFTGPIDAYYDYQFGPLEYKTTRFEHKKLTDTDNYQGVAIMNYTDGEVPYTRIIEYKHFEFGQTDTTCITYEYPEPYVAKVTEPYYPVNDQANNALFSQYKALADAETHVYFGGRLAEYKYYDMHQIIERAFDLLDELNSSIL